MSDIKKTLKDIRVIRDIANLAKRDLKTIARREKNSKRKSDRLKILIQDADFLASECDHLIDGIVKYKKLK